MKLYVAALMPQSEMCGVMGAMFTVRILLGSEVIGVGTFCISFNSHFRKLQFPADQPISYAYKYIFLGISTSLYIIHYDEAR